MLVATGEDVLDRRFEDALLCRSRAAADVVIGRPVHA
jgi:hypothetical protein